MDELSRLLMKAKGGDRPAFAAFVRRTEPMIWRLCAHLVGTADADDAMQETYLAAWHAVPSYRGEASARTWLFVIARRNAERVVRRHRRWLELSEHAPGPQPTPDPQRASEVHELLAELDFDRRTALVLTQILGLSYAEAAEACECAIGTIRSRVARAREELVDRIFQPEDLGETGAN